jgi:hypothetical protein
VTPTPEQIAAIEARLANATPGPWVDMGDIDVYAGEVRAVEPFTAVCRDPELDDRPADRALIANAPTDLRLLLDALATRDAQLAEARTNGAIYAEALGEQRAVCSALHERFAPVEKERDSLRAQLAEAHRLLTSAVDGFVAGDTHDTTARLAAAALRALTSGSTP